MADKGRRLSRRTHLSHLSHRSRFSYLSRRARSTRLTCFLRDESGDAVVEATILFPIIIMVFLAFILLAIYMPTSLTLQRSVQKAALIASAQRSDLGYTYDIANDKAGVNFDKLKKENVYIYMVRGFEEGLDIAEKIVEKYAAYALYEGVNLRIEAAQDPLDDRYIVVSARQTLKLPFDFPFLPVTNEFEIEKSARVVNRDADEFIRNMDIIYDLVIKNSDTVKKTLGDISDFMGVFDRIAGYLGFTK